MGLLDDLRGASGQLDSSLQPTSNEVGPLLGALIAYSEHGQKFLDAAGDDDDGPGAVSKLLSGESDQGDQGDHQGDQPAPESKSDDPTGKGSAPAGAHSKAKPHGG